MLCAPYQAQCDFSTNKWLNIVKCLFGVRQVRWLFPLWVAWTSYNRAAMQTKSGGFSASYILLPSFPNPMEHSNLSPPSASRPALWWRGPGWFHQPHLRSSLQPAAAREVECCQRNIRQDVLNSNTECKQSEEPKKMPLVHQMMRGSACLFPWLLPIFQLLHSASSGTLLSVIWMSEARCRLQSGIGVICGWYHARWMQRCKPLCGLHGLKSRGRVLLFGLKSKVRNQRGHHNKSSPVFHHVLAQSYLMQSDENPEYTAMHLQGEV